MIISEINYINIINNSESKVFSKDNKKYLLKGKLYKNNGLYLDLFNLGIFSILFTNDNDYLVSYKAFYIKCIDCNYFRVYNLNNKRYRDISVYDSNGKLLLVEKFLGYTLDN